MYRHYVPVKQATSLDFCSNSVYTWHCYWRAIIRSSGFTYCRVNENYHKHRNV